MQLSHPMQASISITSRRRLSYHIMLFPVVIDRKALKCQISSGSKMRFNWTRKVEWRLHSKIFHAILHDLEVDGDDTSHLDSTAEGDLTVTLTEMQISNAEFGSFDMNGQIDLASTAEVLDIAVTTVLRTAWNGSCTFFSNFLLDLI